MNYFFMYFFMNLCCDIFMLFLLHIHYLNYSVKGMFLATFDTLATRTSRTIKSDKFVAKNQKSIDKNSTYSRNNCQRRHKRLIDTENSNTKKNSNNVSWEFSLISGSFGYYSFFDLMHDFSNHQKIKIKIIRLI